MHRVFPCPVSPRGPVGLFGFAAVPVLIRPTRVFLTPNPPPPQVGEALDSEGARAAELRYEDAFRNRTERWGGGR